MAERVFTIRTEPHRAVIGETTLFLVPEANSGDFLDSYNQMRTAQEVLHRKTNGSKSSSTKHAKASEVDTEALAQVNRSMRDFVTRFLLPDSVPVFQNMTLPDRVLLELIEFAAELYGGGSGNPDADGGTSTG